MKILKKWWLWVILMVIIIVFVTIIQYEENKKLEETFKNIGQSATDYYNDIQSAKGYSDYFIYNYEAGKVEYHPPITIEKYNNIREGMTEGEVISILGNGEKFQSEGNVGFFITWGSLDLKEYPYYRIQISFDNSGKVLMKNQIGLE